MTPRFDEDAAARRRALSPHASFIVDAPAGAGKTELLTQRILRLLAEADHPEEVVALTFTHKAAAEMRHRLLGSLELAAAGRRPGDEAPHRQMTYDLGRAALARDAALGWQMLEHPGRLAVTTLDALCASLARQMPTLSAFGARPGVTEDAAPHYRAAARRTLALVEEEGDEADIVAAALALMDNDAPRLERLLAELLERRDQWLRHTARSGGPGLRAEAEAGLHSLIERDLAAAARVFPAAVQTRIMPSARYAAANRLAADPATPLLPLADWQMPLTADFADLPRWRALTRLLLTAGGKLRQNLTVNQGFPRTALGRHYKAALLDALALLVPAEEALQALADLPEGVFSDEDWKSVEIFSRLLNIATASLWLSFQEAGEVDFNEIALRALLALGGEEAPTDLALALDYRIRHLLIDEFQDTSPLQIELVAGLTRGWQAGDGRSLFLVGDPMQSIYRFRKADVGLFLKTRESGMGDLPLEKLRLACNHRADPALVEWTNRVFPLIFPAADEALDGAVRFFPALATRPAQPGAGVGLHPLVVEEKQAAGPLEAATVLALLKETRRSRPDEHIAVLTRARSHLEELIALLRKAAPELAFQAVEMEALVGRQGVEDLISLTHALLHRGDRVHWLAVLRAPWCGLTLADLHALAADDHASTLWELINQPERIARLSEDGQARLIHVRAALGEALAGRGRQHPRRWIEGSWRALGGPDCLETDTSDVEALFKLMDKLVAQGRFDAAPLALEAATLFAPPDPSPAAAKLQMMTIHKAKGLEFDTVILPGLHRSTASDKAPLLVWEEVPLSTGGQALVAAPLPQRAPSTTPRTGPRHRSSAYPLLRRLENRRGTHETGRLLYVAATRARRQLHLIGVASRDDDGGLDPPPAASLLRLLWRAGLDEDFSAAFAAPPAPGKADRRGFTPRLVRLRREALPPPLSPIADEAAPAASGTMDKYQAAIGTLTHRCLERIARDGPEHWPPERFAPLEKNYAAWLASQGIDETAATAGGRRVAALLGRLLASPAGRWVLAPRENAGAEIALSAREKNASPAHHVVDRSFIDNGARWIIDYKTLTADPESLARRAEEYRPQLERYARLFKNENHPIRLAVLFVEQACLVEIGQREK